MSLSLGLKCFPWTNLDWASESVENAQLPGNSWDLLQETACTVSILKRVYSVPTWRKMKKEKVHYTSKPEQKYIK